MSSRRSKLEIGLKILNVIRKGVDKPTRIMYAANLSWSPTQKMLSKFVEQGLITVIQNTKGKKSRLRYVITEKGSATLDYFDEASKILQTESLLKA